MALGTERISSNPDTRVAAVGGGRDGEGTMISAELFRQEVD
jgi:hypothetical protein